MSKTCLVELDGIDKRFHTRHFFARDLESKKRNIYQKRHVCAAKKISFGIEPGEIFGLLGPNGAGKTTTVKMISGLVKPDSGLVTVGGLDVERWRRKVLRKVGVVLEGTRTSIWPLTPMENLAYYGNLKNVRGRVLRDRAEQLLDFIGLADKRDVQVRYLSRGQKQKLAICIALIADPEVLLLDEPTTGLDVQSSRAIKDKIIEMTRTQGKSVLVTTHDMHVAQELCDRVGIIKEGELVACKPIDELLGLFSGQVFVFKLDRKPVIDGIDRVPGVMETEVAMESDGPTLRARLTQDYDGRSEALYTLIDMFRKEGYRLRGITQQQQNLESVFLKITEKKS
jgi:ABC-2 type transport system ATP-binding protein